jgi:hypothetical protein
LGDDRIASSILPSAREWHIIYGLKLTLELEELHHTAALESCVNRPSL